MLDGLIGCGGPGASSLLLAGLFGSLWNYFLIFIGFSLVIFFHELGHFIAAKACKVRVDKFAVGFGREILGFTRGETRYVLNILPLGGYVKMLGQEDFAVDKSGELAVKDNPRAFINKPVGLRMIIVSSGVAMNLIFAALVFMLVFMIGLQSLPAEVGWVEPGSPAEQVGLRVGDTIIRVNGEPISDQSDLRAAVVLAHPDSPLELTYRRKDPGTGQTAVETATIRPEKNNEENILRIGVAPPLNSTVAMIIPEPALPDVDQLKLDDRILTVDGRQIAHFYELQHLLADLRGRLAEIKVRRPIPSTQPGAEPASEDRVVKWRARVTFQPSGRLGESSGHLLGLVPRLRLTEVVAGQRAEKAGLQAGDVLVRWGNQIAPRIDEVKTSIEHNPETDVPVVVLRYKGGSATNYTFKVRPRLSGWFVKGEPRIGVVWNAQETDRLVVADIIAHEKQGTDDVEMPTAKLKSIMPRGSEITKVNDEPVRSWDELIQRLIALAGTEVKLAWAYEDQPEASGTFHVPQTLGTTFDLPGSRVITSINDVRHVEVEIDGLRSTFSVDHWIGAREVLKENLGKKVVVKYWDRADRKLFEQALTVTPEMLDTWVMRVQYNVSDVITNLERILVRESNPVKAMMIGVRKTYHFIVQVYVTMKRMIFTRSMGLDQISGPVGIIKMGSDLAAAGVPVLMYFLALISANLAVINFLPLPIFDGGLFVFLIIEKIKGKPISIKVQVATQVIGLALIIGIFLFVTLQDIVKLAGWG